MDGKGQHRTRGVDDASHTAFVNDRSIAFEIGEQLYRRRGYVPPFDDLPWVELGEPPPSRTVFGRIKQR
jgi:hypothetical protein